MPRISIALNAVLVVAVLVMGWVLYKREPVPPAQRLVSAVTTHSLPIDHRAAEHKDVIADNVIINRLHAIDARLSTIEHGLQTDSAHDNTERSIVPVVSAQAATVADRRIKEMFPDSKFDHSETIRFHAALASLPADEQAALSLAFSRAVNSDRLKMRR